MVTNKQDFFYINDYTFSNQVVRKEVNLRNLRHDIKRGVMTLSEDAYCRFWGVTHTSIAFALALQQVFNGTLVGKRAAMKYFEHFNHFILRVKTTSGHEIVFRGVSSGYYGEGPRGAYDILKTFGFNDRQCKVVFEKENFELRNYKL